MLDVKKQRLDVAREEVKFDLLFKDVFSKDKVLNMLFLVEVLVYLREFPN